jgi:hypothetical protein
MTSVWDIALSKNNLPETNLQEDLLKKTSPGNVWDLAEHKSEELTKIKSQEESTTDKLKRGVARTGSRIAETIVGLPGDLLNLVSKGVIYGAEKLKGEPISSKFKESLQETAPFKLLPTSQKLKEFSEKATSGYTSPKSEGEEVGDELTELSTALFQPGKDPNKFIGLVKSVGKSLTKAAGALGAKEGAKQLGAAEGGQAAAEVGSLMLMSLLKPGTTNKYLSGLYQQAKAAVPKGSLVDTRKFLGSLGEVEKELEKGVSTATKNIVLKDLKELQTKAKAGQIPVEDLVQSFHDINETISAKNLFGELSKTEQKNLKIRFDKLKNTIRDELKDYGKKNPEFYEPWSKANEGYAVTAQSRRVSDFLNKNISKGLIGAGGTGLALKAFGISPSIPGSVIGTIGGLGALKSGELMYRISKSPALREHYNNVIKFAIEENVSAMNQALKRLDIGLETLKID